MKLITGVVLLAANIANASECPRASQYQDINFYDGSKGVSIPFVNMHAKHAVGLTGGSGVHCSGTFLPGNKVLTAAHCLGENISGLNVTFNYQLSSSGVLEVQENFPVLNIVERGLLGYDYAILQIGSNAAGVNPADKFPAARLTEFLNPQSNSVFPSINHSGTQPKKVDAGKFLLSKDRGWLEFIRLETWGGASGGGILNDSGYLTGIIDTTSCTGDGLDTITGGHGIRELIRMSPTLNGLYASYKSDWNNRYTNDFSGGIQWANIGSSNWTVSQDTNGNKYAGFYVATATDVTTPKTANLVTHPFIIHAQGSKKVNFSASVARVFSATELNVYVRHGDNRTFMFNKYLAPSSSATLSSLSITEELDLSAFSGVIRLEFEAKSYASQGSIQYSQVTIDNISLPDFSPVLANIAGKNNFISSAWPNASGVGLHAETGNLQAGSYLQGWHSAHWQFKVIDGQYVKISNRHIPNLSLHMEYGALASGYAPDGWHSAQWSLEAAPGYSDITNKAYRIKNRFTNKYLNLEGLTLQASDIPEEYWSSYWNITNI